VIVVCVCVWWMDGMGGMDEWVSEWMDGWMGDPCFTHMLNRLTRHPQPDN
jgi:hypothetical protein